MRRVDQLQMYTQSQASTAADQHHSAALSKNTIHAWSLLHWSGGTLENRNRLSAILHCTVGLFDLIAYHVPVNTEYLGFRKYWNSLWCLHWHCCWSWSVPRQPTLNIHHPAAVEFKKTFNLDCNSHFLQWSCHILMKIIFPNISEWITDHKS